VQVFDNLVLSELPTGVVASLKEQKKDDWREGMNEEEQTEQSSEVA
jgi:hypothetical protein